MYNQINSKNPNWIKISLERKVKKKKIKIEPLRSIAMKKKTRKLDTQYFIESENLNIRIWNYENMMLLWTNKYSPKKCTLRWWKIICYTIKWIWILNSITQMTSSIKKKSSKISKNFNENKFNWIRLLHILTWWFKFSNIKSFLGLIWWCVIYELAHDGHAHLCLMCLIFLN